MLMVSITKSDTFISGWRDSDIGNRRRESGQQYYRTSNCLHDCQRIFSHIVMETLQCVNLQTTLVVLQWGVPERTMN